MPPTPVVHSEAVRQRNRGTVRARGSEVCRRSLRWRGSTPVESRVTWTKCLHTHNFCSSVKCLPDPLSRARDAARLAHPPRLEGRAEPRVERQNEPTTDTLWTDVAERLRGALNDT